MGELEKKKDAVTALCRLIDGMQERFRDTVGHGVGPLPGREESWAVTHWHTEDVVEQLQLARAQFAESDVVNFLECGSGFGFVGAMAGQLDFSVTCLEIEPRYIQWSKRLFPGTHVIEQDLRTFEKWELFDVIYYYAPFHDAHPELTEKFEHAVEDGMKPGAVLIANHKSSERWKTDPRFVMLRNEADMAFVLRKKP